MKPQNMDDSNVDLSALAEFHLRIPGILKNWKSEIPPPSDVLEIGPEWRRLRLARDRDAEAETCPEAGNPVTRRCQSGRDPGAVGEIRGSGEVRVEGF